MLIEDYKEQIYNCGRCGYCIGAYLNHICPSRFIAGFESATGRGRMLIAQALLEGKLEYSENLVSMLYTCFLCGACSAKCESAAKIKIVEITKAMRSDSLNFGIQLEKLVPGAKAIMEQHNIYSEPSEKRTTFLTPDSKISEKADLLYFPGCVITFRYPNIVRNALKILNMAGIDVTVLGEEEWCCGNPLYFMGMTEAAKKIAQHNVEKIREKGAKTVLTSCAGCYRAIKQDYEKILGQPLPFNVVHITQFLDKLVNEGSIKLGKSCIKKVTYHDPCEIGRYFKIYEAPRRILQNVPDLDFVEMPRHGDNSWCCGGGGSVNIVHTYQALKVGELRIIEAKETGAKTLVTACPSCVQMLELASKRKRTGMKVIDISELVLDALRT